MSVYAEPPPRRVVWEDVSGTDIYDSRHFRRPVPPATSGIRCSAGRGTIIGEHPATLSLSP